MWDPRNQVRKMYQGVGNDLVGQMLRIGQI